MARVLDQVEAGPLGMLPERIRQELIDPSVPAAIASIPVHVSEYGFDPWRLSPEVAKVTYSLASRIARYFRPEIRGIEKLPGGRVLIVPNHSGQLPYDG